ncbi:hypothetical protein [Actinomadura rayongensis]|uniref:Uncharacterized protein n=1 Tax=Actinomadura rayongensis TaxID=1429076 RepID=A0A6I4W693_9ACTN|nr:hypothetical protein [Actinomadura rayongensis]MXQ65068.1 hypothetical protein [Actinomadura rayongensis]
MTHPDGHLLVLLRSFFPRWRLAIDADGMWLAHSPAEDRVAVSGRGALELLDALHDVDPDAFDLIAELLSRPADPAGAAPEDDPEFVRAWEFTAQRVSRGAVRPVSRPAPPIVRRRAVHRATAGLGVLTVVAAGAWLWFRTHGTSLVTPREESC